MRVVCINEDAWPDPSDANYKEDAVLINGNFYDVISVQLRNGFVWYELKQNPGTIYWDKCFAQLAVKKQKQ